VAARRKRPEEEIDLVVINPAVQETKMPTRRVWTSSELRHVARAMISIRGWYTDTFSPSLLGVSPEVFRFAEEPVNRYACRMLGDGPMARILCVPALPTSEKLRKESLDIMQQNGVDGVLLFKNMLLELAAHVETQKSYEKSDLMQVLRILKNYNLLRDAQLELFPQRSRKGRKKA
jgi:hypothetical protein